MSRYTGSMWLTDGRRSLLVEGERLARVEEGRRGRRFEAITPGLQDAHAHPLYWGMALRGLDLSGLKDPEEVALKAAERAKALPRGAWLEGQGFLFPKPPPPGLLDRAAPENPVFFKQPGLPRPPGSTAWRRRGRGLPQKPSPRRAGPSSGVRMAFPTSSWKGRKNWFSLTFPHPPPRTWSGALGTSPAGGTPRSTSWATSLLRPWTGLWGWSFR
jgi:hypothetical protein